MNITFFSPTLNPGGYEKVVVAFANELSKNSENSITILCCDAQGKLRNEISSNVTVTSFNCRTKSLLPHLILYFRKSNIDVFYTGFRIYNFIALLARSISNADFKICCSQHGYENSSKFMIYMYRLLINRSDLFLGVTKNVLRYETQILNIRCNCDVLGNPVISNIEIMTIEDNWFDDNIPIIVTCGRLSIDKNYILAIKILKKLLDMGYKFKLLMIGDGPEKNKIEELVDKFDLNNFVKMIGYVSNPIDYMSKCDIYLHTCNQEGFGNTVVEAMYAGLPIVTTYCGGPVDLIDDGVYGRFFGKENNDNMDVQGAKTVLQVYLDKDKYINQRKRALDFTSKNITSLLYEKFKNILD